VDVDRAIAKEAAEAELSRDVKVDIAENASVDDKARQFWRDLRSVEDADRDIAMLA
jgi:hypothetical protein